MGTATTFRTFTAWGWREANDPVAAMAQDFAAKLADIRCIRAVMAADAGDAAQVNAAITMVAAEAAKLIDALIEDADAHGLDQSGDWIGGPVRELQAFDVARREAA